MRGQSHGILHSWEPRPHPPVRYGARGSSLCPKGAHSPGGRQLQTVCWVGIAGTWHHARWGCQGGWRAKQRLQTPRPRGVSLPLSSSSHPACPPPPTGAHCARQVGRRKGRCLPSSSQPRNDSGVVVTKSCLVPWLGNSRASILPVSQNFPAGRGRLPTW